MHEVLTFFSFDLQGFDRQMPKEAYETYKDFVDKYYDDVKQPDPKANGQS